MVIVKPEFSRKTKSLCRAVEIEDLPTNMRKTQDRPCLNEDKLCFVIYAVQDNDISDSPASPLLSITNEETQAENRRDYNTANVTGLSLGFYQTFYIFLNNL